MLRLGEERASAWGAAASRSRERYAGKFRSPIDATGLVRGIGLGDSPMRP